MRVYHRTKQSTSRFFFFLYFLQCAGQAGMVTYNDVDYVYVYHLQAMWLH